MYLYVPRMNRLKHMAQDNSLEFVDIVMRRVNHPVSDSLKSFKLFLFVTYRFQKALTLGQRVLHPGLAVASQKNFF